MSNAKAIVEVMAGIVPNVPETEYTRRWVLSSDEWEAAGDKAPEKLAILNGQAIGYAALLMLQPDRFNLFRWVACSRCSTSRWWAICWSRWRTSCTRRNV